MDQKAFYFLVSGKVQGVGFRRFSQRVAKKRNLGGWVRNLANGQVEGLVVGESKVLEEFLLVLERGPSWTEVEKLLHKTVEEVKPLEGFIIKEDGDSPCYKV